MKIEIKDGLQKIDIFLDTEKVSYAVCKKSTTVPASVAVDVIQTHKDYFDRFKRSYFYEWTCYTVSGQEVIVIVYDDDSQAKMDSAIKFGQYFNEPVYAIIYKTK